MVAVRSLALALAVCAAVLSAGPARAGFVEGYEDLPLPPGFTEQPGASLTFDSPDGRIVEVQASGPAGADPLAFYAATLPHLGWVRESAGQYRRESERLRLTVVPGPRGTSLRLAVTPD